MSNWIEASVKEVVWWTDTLFSLIVNADVEPFKAGQFTKLSMMIDDKRIARAYSYVNAPNSNDLEFYLINVMDGLLSQQLAKLTPGDTVLIESRASGFFTIDEIPASEQLFMLSTGTAIGPFLSILDQADVWQKFKQITLVHGVRLNADLSYQKKINQLQQQYTRLRYVPVVSREQAIIGLNGRITDKIIDGSLFKHSQNTTCPQNSQFMICGNPQMVKDTSALLIEQGYSRNRRREPGQITVEQYW
ncbi:ferredoxin-NADP reductase [Pseudoalteromonas porphyrae]|uniref:ferredoxin--NADP(+) reductase n=2 Tax=Pseudoalteromonas TaxID=53246 RepID=A0A0N0M1S4_9GAMM|nr:MULTISPECIES: ferredoxin--NADP reductase [Pseudoalteromonas]KPH65558.1 ferredoxin-NADP reductase [Pseudoalteromonas porphyrae]KPH95617.1 ferredoxin-NADP reductase [Pseudoalteromonas porphyrae]